MDDIDSIDREVVMSKKECGGQVESVTKAGGENGINDNLIVAET